ncbi:hypothetical protein M1146_06390, partial [Patescibacteria group bacterium]|nr:hypothetical protein [Patescibacteria group bacterium]
FYAVPENMTMLEEHIINQILNVLYTSFVQHNESKWIETAYSLLGIIKARLITTLIKLIGSTKTASISLPCSITAK